MKKLLVSLFLINAFSAQAIEPSQAYSEVAEVAQTLIANKFFTRNLHFSNINIGLGKYSEGLMGNYIVKLFAIDKETSEFVTNCSINLTIKRVPFAKQTSEVVILETVINHYQIVAKPFFIDCKMPEEKTF